MRTCCSNDRVIEVPGARGTTSLTSERTTQPQKSITWQMRGWLEAARPAGIVEAVLSLEFNRRKQNDCAMEKGCRRSLV
jgi:hypothetical protein